MCVCVCVRIYTQHGQTSFHAVLCFTAFRALCYCAILVIPYRRYRATRDIFFFYAREKSRYSLNFVLAHRSRVNVRKYIYIRAIYQIIEKVLSRRRFRIILKKKRRAQFRNVRRNYFSRRENSMYIRRRFAFFTNERTFALVDVFYLFIFFFSTSALVRNKYTLTCRTYIHQTPRVKKIGRASFNISSVVHIFGKSVETESFLWVRNGHRVSFTAVALYMKMSVTDGVSESKGSYHAPPLRINALSLLSFLNGQFFTDPLSDY